MTFLDLEKTPLPPPAFGCAFIADLTPESIAKAEREAMADLKRNQQQSATVFDYQAFARGHRNLAQK